MTTIKFKNLDRPKGEVMKKPVKPVDAVVQERASKRKHILVTREKNLKAGSLDDIAQQVMDFASEQGVAVGDVRVSAGNNAYWNSQRASMKVRRHETDAERLERTRADLLKRYENDAWEYRNWKRNEEYRKEREQRAALEKKQAELKKQGKCIHCGK